MLEATQLTGFGADDLTPGPHELFYAGRRSENSSFRAYPVDAYTYYM